MVCLIILLFGLRRGRQRDSLKNGGWSAFAVRNDAENGLYIDVRDEFRKVFRIGGFRLQFRGH
jgi:hypothetical protein